jgi:hypothetical protein
MELDGGNGCTTMSMNLNVVHWNIAKILNIMLHIYFLIKKEPQLTLQYIRISFMCKAVYKVLLMKAC